mgnify:CR=1 FL=1|jgi:uncharacterized protein
MNIDKDTLFVRSDFVQTIRKGNDVIIWHSLFGFPKVISPEAQKFLNLFIVPKTLRSIYGEYDLSIADRKFIKEMITAYYLIPKNFDERNFMEKKNKLLGKDITSGLFIKNLGLIMAEVCNFRCVYCIHFNNLETSHRVSNTKKIMSFETARRAVDEYFKILSKKQLAKSGKKEVAKINFGGGEPLLNWPVIKKVLEYCQVNYGDKFVFDFSINTNASLLTAEIIGMLKRHNVSVASSLDGLRQGNDKVRLTKSGKGTFGLIVQGFDSLAKENYPINGFSFTVNEKNFRFLDKAIIDWAFKRKMREVRVDIDVVGMVNIPVEDIVARLMMIRQYAKRKNIEVFGFWSRPAENLNKPTISNHVAFCGAVAGDGICVNPSGEIYTCGYSTTQIGTLEVMDTLCVLGSPYYGFVQDHLTGRIKRCEGCMIEGACGGGCNITCEFARAFNTYKIERMCEFYRSATRELLLEQLREI